MVQDVNNDITIHQAQTPVVQVVDTTAQQASTPATGDTSAVQATPTADANSQAVAENVSSQQDASATSPDDTTEKQTTSDDSSENTVDTSADTKDTVSCDTAEKTADNTSEEKIIKKDTPTVDQGNVQPTTPDKCMPNPSLVSGCLITSNAVPDIGVDRLIDFMQHNDCGHISVSIKIEI